MCLSVEHSLDSWQELGQGFVRGGIDVNEDFLGRGDHFLVLLLLDAVGFRMVRQRCLVRHAQHFA